MDFPELEEVLLRLEAFEMLSVMYTSTSAAAASELPPSFQARIRDALPALAGMGKLSFPGNGDEE